MSQHSTSPRNTSVLPLLQPLFAFYKARQLLLINFLRAEGYTDTRIAHALGVSKQAVSQNYPRVETKQEPKGSR